MGANHGRKPWTQIMDANHGRKLWTQKSEGGRFKKPSALAFLSYSLSHIESRNSHRLPQSTGEKPPLRARKSYFKRKQLVYASVCGP